MRKSANKLTKHECNYASSTTYPQIKHEVMQKTNVLFNSLGQKLSQSECIPAIYRNQNYKITRGENYQLMPYMVLDYPQIKDKAFTLVMRTMFWWGHFISCQLIVQTAQLNIEATANNLAGKRKTRLWTASNLWDHDCKSDAFTKLKYLSAAEIQSFLEHQTHLKLVSTHSIDCFNTFENIALKQYEQWMERFVWA
jgi:hypothetical protein